MPTDAQRSEFMEGTVRLATEHGFPVLTPPGRFVHDARCAWLVEALEAHLEASWEPRVRLGWFSASALGKSDTELIAAYRGEEFEPPPGAQKLRVFSVGIDRDATYKRWLSECGLSVVADDADRQVKIPYLRLMGSCDDVLRGPDGFVVLELKTINPFQFQRLEAPLRRGRSNSAAC